MSEDLEENQVEMNIFNNKQEDATDDSSFQRYKSHESNEADDVIVSTGDSLNTTPTKTSNIEITADRDFYPDLDPPPPPYIPRHLRE